MDKTILIVETCLGVFTIGLLIGHWLGVKYMEQISTRHMNELLEEMYEIDPGSMFTVLDAISKLRKRHRSKNEELAEIRELKELWKTKSKD